ncbi:MAG: preprotein translocase subunit SecA [bacterium]|nr:preprotein translocase subunit SecA [bacterium]
MSLFKKIFGDANNKVIRNLDNIVSKVNSFEESLDKLTDTKLSLKTREFKDRLGKDEKLDDILPEAFAVVREAIKRTLGQRAYDVQIMSATVLHQGKISEQKTGEGKTLSATISAYLNALEGKGVHIITVNDYLARRDAGWYGVALNKLGLKIGCIAHDQAFELDMNFSNDEVTDERLSHLKPVSRQEAYLADITYGTNNEFGFDYLRDNMVPALENKVQRGLNYAIVDEVDSILIDEARTPLIISAPAEDSSDMYYKFSKYVSGLEEDKDYNIDEKMRAATLTEEGISKMEKMLGLSNIYEADGIETVHHIEQALKAKALFTRDKDYVVKEGEVIIVDEFTGRMMYGRRYSEGLHQAIEAKENVEIKKESRTMATITFQNYFRMYKKLSGMTGTAATEAEEFHKIYELEVVVVPTNKPLGRIDKQDSIYKNTSGKYKAVIRDIKIRNEIGQPVLIGTISIEKNELLSQLLEREGVKHNLLNAKNHEKEASVLAEAGAFGAVTVATNMAGRGVDIILGGQKSTPEEQEKIKKLGGLHVIGTERHESRRIDNQLRGRAGRQGDLGSSQFFVCMEDDLMRIFGSDRMKSMMDRLGLPDDMPIENKIITKSIESAQKKVESHHFDTRKHLVEYDDIINKHREVIYAKRNELLEFIDAKKSTDQEGENKIKEKILELIESEIEQVVSFHTSSDNESIWNIDEIYEVADTIFPISLENRIKLEDVREKAGDKEKDAEARTAIIQYLFELAKERYADLEKRINDPKMMKNVERAVYLRAIDTLWIEHLDLMDHLRQGIGLRGYGQQDPLVAYKKEAYKLFNELINNIQKNVVYTIYKVGLTQNIGASPMESSNQQYSAPAKTSDQAPASPYQNMTSDGSEQPAPAVQTIGDTKQTAGGNLKTKDGKKVGRNDPCPCGSGKKYKKCHGK